MPAGVRGGQAIQIRTPTGQTMQVAVPAGLAAGQRFRVSVPTSAMGQQQYQQNMQRQQYQQNMQRQLAAQESQRQAHIQQQLAKQRQLAPRAPTAVTKTAQIQLPPGVVAGNTLTVNLPNGSQVQITVPAGTKPGSVLNVQYQDMSAPAPSSSPPSNSQVAGTCKVKVVVPKGAVAGMKIRVSHDGYEYDVVVPNGVLPGGKFIAVLPSALAMQQRRIHAQLEAEAAALKQQRDIMSAEKEKQAQAMIERSMRMQDEARKVFEQYDVNYDNAIDPAELLQLLQDSGFPKSVIEEELLNADADGDHLISFDECTLHRDFLGGVVPHSSFMYLPCFRLCMILKTLAAVGCALFSLFFKALSL